MGRHGLERGNGLAAVRIPCTLLSACFYHGCNASPNLHALSLPPCRRMTDQSTATLSTSASALCPPDMMETRTSTRPNTSIWVKADDAVISGTMSPR